jgi:sugar lactone lactonase YvrE
MEPVFSDTPELVVTGLAWPESPRWHQGKLWFSDVHHYRVACWSPGRELQIVCHAPGRPAGMGFMPDGRLLLATALDKKLWWVSPDGELELALDVADLVVGVLNDMIVDPTGRAWFGDTGFDLLRGEPARPGALLTWIPGETTARVAASDIEFPNGIVMAADGKSLFLAETLGRRITAFDVERGGHLCRRRLHVALEERPDGLCGDRANGLWVPLLWQQEIQHIASSGTVTRRVRFAQERAISCVLGGEDRRSLFVGIARVDESDKSNVKRVGSIVRISVEEPGAGTP